MSKTERGLTWPLLTGLYAAVVFASTISGQCPTEWQRPNLGPFGVVGKVNATAQWDPDGSGPLPEVIVLGGDFVAAGGLEIANLAVWNLQTQQISTLGSPPNGAVRTLAVDASGQLHVGGEFSTIDGIAAGSIARWNGTTWQSLGSGTDGLILTLLAEPNGDLIAGGTFGLAGGIAARNIARWDGNAWSAYGLGLGGSTSEVRTLARIGSGDIAAGGLFTSAGGVGVRHLARWNGTTWSDLSANLLIWDETWELLTLPNGDLMATGAGLFAFEIVYSNGQWTAPFVPSLGLNTLTRTPSGRVFACTRGGQFDGPDLVELVNGTPQIVVTLPGPGGRVCSMTTVPGGASDDLVMAGDFPGGSVGMHVAGTLTTGPVFTDGIIAGLTYAPDGTLYATGGFSQIAGVPAVDIASWNGSSWQALPGLSIGPRRVAVRSNGDVCVADNALNANVQSWDGAAWQSLIPPPVGAFSMLAASDGSLFLGGVGVYRYEGTTWTRINELTRAYFLHEFTSGDIGVASPFQSLPTGETVAIWDGQTAVGLPTPFAGPIRAVAATPDDRFLIAPANPTLGPLFAWNGSGWQAVAGITGTVTHAVNFANGDVAIGGDFVLTTTGQHCNLARWDGVSFAAIQGVPRALIRALACGPDGTLAVAWGGSTSAALISFLTNSCPATRTDLGPGCPGSGGQNLLVSRRWPTVGATYVADGIGLPDLCIIVDVYGTATTSLSLANLLPGTGQQGCTLHVSPFFQVAAIATGSSRSTLAVPAAATLIGQTFHHQLVPIELDSLGNLDTATASNALSVTIGGSL